MWKVIPEYEDLYLINDYGEIKRKTRILKDGRRIQEKILLGGVYPNGYKFVGLTKNGITKNHLVHRLVAKTFLRNPKNYKVVNHKDGNKFNNSKENLEWCTQSFNLKHAVKIGLVENQCKIRRSVIISNGDVNIKFSSMKDCAAWFGFKKGWLHNKIRKYGSVFNYKDFKIEVMDRGDVGHVSL